MAVKLPRKIQTAIPNNAPTPAVIPIASAPQNVTRVAAFKTGDPPTFEEKIPNKARHSNEVKETDGIRIEAGNINTVNMGIAASYCESTC